MRYILNFFSYSIIFFLSFYSISLGQSRSITINASVSSCSNISMNCNVDIDINSQSDIDSIKIAHSKENSLIRGECRDYRFYKNINSTEGNLSERFESGRYEDYETVYSIRIRSDNEFLCLKVVNHRLNAVYSKKIFLRGFGGHVISSIVSNTINEEERVRDILVGALEIDLTNPSCNTRLRSCTVGVSISTIHGIDEVYGLISNSIRCPAKPNIYKIVPISTNYENENEYLSDFVLHESKVGKLEGKRLCVFTADNSDDEEYIVSKRFNFEEASNHEHMSVLSIGRIPQSIRRRNLRDIIRVDDVRAPELNNRRSRNNIEIRAPGFTSGNSRSTRNNIKIRAPGFTSGNSRSIRNSIEIRAPRSTSNNNLEIRAPISTSNNKLEIRAPRTSSNNKLEIRAPRTSSNNKLEIRAPRTSSNNNLEIRAPRTIANQNQISIQGDLTKTERILKIREKLIELIGLLNRIKVGQ